MNELIAKSYTEITRVNKPLYQLIYHFYEIAVDTGDHLNEGESDDGDGHRGHDRADQRKGQNGALQIKSKILTVDVSVVDI